jgi:hypothetical protein
MTPSIFEGRRGWRLVSIERIGDETFIRLEAKIDRYHTVPVVVAVAKGQLTYIYNAVDPSTATLTVYHGPHGDPALDEIGAVAGIEL